MESWAERVERQLHAKQRLCGRCGKVSHDSEKDARRVVREYHQRNRLRPYYFRGDTPGLTPKTVYFDKLCGVWHVTKDREPRKGADHDDAVFLDLPPAPAVDWHRRPAKYREALALSLRDAIARQGPGYRLPFRRALEKRYPAPWPLVAQVRSLLVETGWLDVVADGHGYVTTAGPRGVNGLDDPAGLPA